MKAKDDWKKNVQAFIKIVNNEPFDLVIGDETYEISMAFKKHHIKKEIPYIVFYDFYGNASTSRSPKELLGTYVWNRVWIKNPEFWDGKKHFILFIGEPEDIPDDSLGFLLPNRRTFARKVCNYVGNVIPFNPSDYTNRNALRKKLGYGNEPFIICSVGGTSVGRELLTLCGQAYTLVREQIHDLKMVVVGGPRLSYTSLKLPEGVDVRGYVPKLYEHFAASDLSIVQGGLTSTIELTALNKPFIYFPLEGHFEQMIHVAHRLERLNAGIKLIYSKTTPERLAEKIIDNLGGEVNYPNISFDGAHRAAKAIMKLL